MDDDRPRTRPQPPGSPLDPFLDDFLRVIDDLAHGYAPTSHQDIVTSALDWPTPFVDAIFTSARARGMVEPFRGAGYRGRSRWHVSARGRARLAGLAVTGRLDPADAEPASH